MICRKIFDCCEKTDGDILAKQVWKCFIWVSNLGTIHGEAQLNRFLPRQTTKVDAVFQWWSALKGHNTKPTSKLMLTSWFPANFAVHLWDQPFRNSQLGPKGYSIHSQHSLDWTMKDFPNRNCASSLNLQMKWDFISKKNAKIKIVGIFPTLC